MVQLDAGGGLELLFDREYLTYEPVELKPNLYGTQWTPAEAQKEYGLMKLHSKMVYNLVFQNPLMVKLLDMVPSLSELLLLGKLWFTLEQTDEKGEPVWDVVVVDAPATGHSISMLRVPRVIQAMMGVGPMAEDSRRIEALLTDPRRTGLWIVTLAEELPVREAISFFDANREELGLKLERFVLNQCLQATQEDCDDAGRTLSGLGEVPGGVHAALHSLHTGVQQQAEFEQELRTNTTGPIGESLYSPLKHSG